MNISVIYNIFNIKGIVHFEIKIWYLSAYPKGIQDVGRRQRLTEGVSEAWCTQSLHATPEKYVIGCCNYDGASAVSTTLQTRPPSSVDADAPCECSVSQSACTHTRHTPDACALRSLGHGCVQEVKKRYKYCSFSHTNSSFRVLGHQCVVTMGNCLIWISLCMFFFPLIETVTYTCHYMTDRLERFDLKTSKLDLLKKKRHLHLGCPWGKLIDTKF